MEPYAIITPSRGDRPRFLEFCKYQVSKFTIQPAKHYIIDYTPESDKVDISERLQLGVQMAKSDGIDLVFVIEDDDSYPTNYIERFGETKDHHFFGAEYSIYYNIKNGTWGYFGHALRSSLFCTGFRVSAMEGFKWPEHTPFLDIAIWKHAELFGKKFIADTGAIGIKHGIGKCGGRGHTMVLPNKDLQMNLLKSKVSKEAFEFYCSLGL